MIKNKIRVNLWGRPYNGGWVWFDKKQIKRFDYGWHKPTLWGCVFGICWRITLQTWPWQHKPSHKVKS